MIVAAEPAPLEVQVEWPVRFLRMETLPAAGGWDLNRKFLKYSPIERAIIWH